MNYLIKIFSVAAVIFAAFFPFQVFAAICEYEGEILISDNGSTTLDGSADTYFGTAADQSSCEVGGLQTVCVSDDEVSNCLVSIADSVWTPYYSPYTCTCSGFNSAHNLYLRDNDDNCESFGLLSEIATCGEEESEPPVYADVDQLPALGIAFAACLFVYFPAWFVTVVLRR